MKHTIDPIRLRQFFSDVWFAEQHGRREALEQYCWDARHEWQQAHRDRAFTGRIFIQSEARRMAKLLNVHESDCIAAAESVAWGSETEAVLAMAAAVRKQIEGELRQQASQGRTARRRASA